MALFGSLRQRLQLAGLPARPADLHPVVLARRCAAVLGARRLLRLAVPVRRPAGITNQIARKLHVPQWTLPWGLHERLWPVKYMIFLGLFGVSLMSVEQAEHLAEVEPFKTAIILKFVRAWPFVAYAAALLAPGCSSSASTAAISARWARRWRSRRGSGCSTG
jgi:hypothetical protein